MSVLTGVIGEVSTLRKGGGGSCLAQEMDMDMDRTR